LFKKRARLGLQRRLAAVGLPAELSTEVAAAVYPTPDSEPLLHGPDAKDAAGIVAHALDGPGRFDAADLLGNLYGSTDFPFTITEAFPHLAAWIPLVEEVLREPAAKRYAYWPTRFVLRSEFDSLRGEFHHLAEAHGYRVEIGQLAGIVAAPIRYHGETMGPGKVKLGVIDRGATDLAFRLRGALATNAEPEPLWEGMLTEARTHLRSVREGGDKFSAVADGLAGELRRIAPGEDWP